MYYVTYSVILVEWYLFYGIVYNILCDVMNLHLDSVPSLVVGVSSGFLLLYGAYLTSRNQKNTTLSLGKFIFILIYLSINLSIYLRTR